MTLGNHLRAHQDVHLAGMHAGQLGLQRSLESRGVRVDARHPRPRQGHGQLLFEALGAAAHRLDVGIAAVRACARHPHGESAVVASKRPVHAVEHAPGAAMGATALPAAVHAFEHRRIAAPVEEHQALLATSDAILQGRDQGRRKRRVAGHLLGDAVHVDEAHLRQGAPADPRGHGKAPVASTLGLVPAFQRRGGRAQDHGSAFELAAIDREVARRVTGAFLALVGRVVLLVDHDQPEARHGAEHRQPRAEHDVGAAQVGRQPVLEPLCRGETAVQGHDQAARKALGKSGFELRSQVDFRHQHQRLSPALQHAGDGAQVDLGLAAAGAAVQQDGPTMLVLQAVERGLLLGRQLRHLRCRSVGRGQLLELLEPGCELLVVELAQLRRQHRQRHLADAALIVGGREAEPVRTMRQAAAAGCPWPGSRRATGGPASALRPRQARAPRKPSGGREAPAPAYLAGQSGSPR